MRECLIIDDIEPALAAMSELGRAILTAPVERLRQRVLEYAARREWVVVRHRAFAEWAHELIGRGPDQWLSLDPLLNRRSSTERLSPLRLSREFDGGATVLRGPMMTGLESISAVAAGASGVVGVIDDAVSSGRTLSTAVRRLGEQGIQVSHVMVCASAKSARDAFRQRHRTVKWNEYFVGDWVILHLRDGCPMLPFTGRPTHEHIALGDGRPALELRVPTNAVPGHPWQVLCMNADVRAAVRDAIAEATELLSSQLGRPAVIADLRLLGDQASVMRGAANVSWETPLADLKDAS